MKHKFKRMLTWIWRWGLFVLAFLIVVFAVVSLDTFVIEQRLYFLRAGAWEELLLITALGLLIAYVLKRLLVLQWKWGVGK
ncbi:MAG: hypothetical protein Q8P05_01915 [Candidatus Diapherotrites archaeon]|nr:hypothetical protein [Candidatus Diapherotrites archaeon]MDZ4256951.1 hypothetical protein [archaeon]